MSKQETKYFLGGFFVGVTLITTLWIGEVVAETRTLSLPIDLDLSPTDTKATHPMGVEYCRTLTMTMPITEAQCEVGDTIHRDSFE